MPILSSCTHSVPTHTRSRAMRTCALPLQGPWLQAHMENPDYYKDDTPYANMGLIGGVGIEVGPGKGLGMAGFEVGPLGRGMVRQLRPALPPPTFPTLDLHPALPSRPPFTGVVH